ncbi:SusD/RagB family nutrient-binding outer membrane lipoprotein, partial [Bacteroides xylanisolvens]
MKKNTIIQFIVTGMFLFGATACTGNFEDYNKNPHEPDQNDMGVDWYLVRSLALNLQDLMMPEQENFSQYVDCLMAGAFSGYVADSNLGTGWSGRYATYNPSDDWKKIPFNDFYSKFYPDYFNLKNQSDDELFLSLAELYRIVVMLRVTDTYGPIPYSKVGAANA